MRKIKGYDIKLIGNQWFSLRFLMAYLSDYRILRLRIKRGTGNIVYIKDIKQTKLALYSLAEGIKKLADKL